MTPFEAMFGKPYRGQTSEPGPDTDGEAPVAEINEEGSIMRTSGPIRISTGPDDPDKLRLRYLEAAAAAHDKTRKIMMKRSGNPETFEIGDAVYVKALVNPQSKRGKLSNRERWAGEIVGVRTLPSGERKHTLRCQNYWR